MALNFVSVIIPVYNDENGIKDTLFSLSHQEYPSNLWEIIVVDNNSTDNTFNAAESYKKKIQCKFKVEIELKQGSYAARNKGISLAKGDYLLFIDANMTMNEHWLTNTSHFIKTTQSEYFAFNVSITVSSNSIYEIDEQLTGFPVGFYLKKMQFAPTCCLGISANIIPKVGKFDHRLISGGDQEFGDRVFNFSYSQEFASEIVVYHPARSSFSEVWKKNIRIGRGFFQLSWLYPSRFKNKIRSILSPIYFLPPSPLKLIKIMRFENRRKNLWNELPFHIKFGVFLLWWIRKIAIHSGYTHEWLLHKSVLK